MTREIEKQKGDIPKDAKNKDLEVFDPVEKTRPFISFQYSYKSVTSAGGKTHIKSKKKSFEKGIFQSEEFEGTLDGSVYSNVVGEMQKRIWNQVTAFLKPLGRIGKDPHSK